MVFKLKYISNDLEYDSVITNILQEIPAQKEVVPENKKIDVKTKKLAYENKKTKSGNENLDSILNKLF